MKKTMTLAFLLTLLFPACTEQLLPQQEGTLSVTVYDGDRAATRASDETEFAYEKKINSIQLFLFDGATLFNYTYIDTKNATFPYNQTWTALKSGSYKIYAVANAASLEHIATEADLLSATIRLSDCGLTESTGFIMAGDNEVTVRPGQQESASVALHRFAARVRLVSVENAVPSTYAGGGTVALKGVFLINAQGQWNLGGTGPASEWVNLGGRDAGKPSSSARSDFIVSAGQVNPSAYQNQVFRTLNDPILCGSRKEFTDCCLYSFPNAVVTDRTGNLSTEAEGAPTRLVVLAQVNGADWWYPVTLLDNGKGLERNTTYDVRLVLRATGSSDPNEPVVHGSLQASLSVTGWTGSTEYTETI